MWYGSRKKSYQGTRKRFRRSIWNEIFETSAKDSTNVAEAFVTMTKEVIKGSNKKTPGPKKDNVVVSNAPTGKTLNSGKGCC